MMWPEFLFQNIKHPCCTFACVFLCNSESVSLGSHLCLARSLRWVCSPPHWEHTLLFEAHLLVPFHVKGSTYSGTFQLSSGWLIIGPVWLGLWCSYGMQFGWQVSLSHCFNTMVAAWIATCVIAVWISSKFAPLHLFRICPLSNLCMFQSLYSFESLFAYKCFHLPSWDFYSWQHVMLLATE